MSRLRMEAECARKYLRPFSDSRRSKDVAFPSKWTTHAASELASLTTEGRVDVRNVRSLVLVAGHQRTIRWSPTIGFSIKWGGSGKQKWRKLSSLNAHTINSYFLESLKFLTKTVVNKMWSHLNNIYLSNDFWIISNDYSAIYWIDNNSDNVDDMTST